MTEVLVTGATGVVGQEVLRHARRRPGWHVVGASARGDAAAGVHSWRQGQEAAPPALQRPWDVVINAAGKPQWNATPVDAQDSHVRTLAALDDVLGSSTHLVHVSTAFAIGRTGDVESDDPDDYHNNYEWAKAAAERALRHRAPYVTVLRPPLLIGRRSDGFVARFTGMYSILRALTSGHLPALVAERDGLIEMVPTDDFAELAVEAAAGEPSARTWTTGRGADAVTVGDFLTHAFSTLNAWRGERGVNVLDVPKLVTPEQWHRFFHPFIRPHLSTLQSLAIDLLSEFEPYLCRRQPMHVDITIADPVPALRASIRYWADAHPRLAASTPLPWREGIARAQ